MDTNEAIGVFRKTDVGVPLLARAGYEVAAYPADQLPPELAKVPAVKPSSRNT